MNEQIIQPRWRAWEVIVGIVGVVLTMIAFGYLVELTYALWKINELFFIFWASFMQTLLMISVSWYIAVVKAWPLPARFGFCQKRLFAGSSQGD